MLIYKIFAILFLPTTPFVAQYVVKFLSLKRQFKLTWRDLAWPLFAFELILVSRRFFANDFLPHYLFLLSGLALFLALSGLGRIRSKDYFFGTFFKNFYRLIFPATLLAYGLTVLICLFK